jgi:hypothetical protein
MKYWLASLTIFAVIAIGSFCIGQGKTTMKNQAASDIKLSDHDKIEQLLGEVVELRKQLTALTRKYDTHMHPLRNLAVASLPGSIECNQTVVGWASTGIHREPVEKVCRQLMNSSMNVLVPGKEPTVTGPPSP